MTSYGQIEVGRIGMGCCDASDASDVHVLSDICAVTSSPRRIKGPTELHSALTLTVVIPAAPKVLINTELDDCAIFESRRCSCPLGELGLTMHLRDIRSYGKLTDEGVTVLESEWTHVLEDVLPRHFGGSAIDYQLLEEEDEAGLSRITLIVDPGIPIASDADIVRVALEALGQRSLGAEAARQVWSRTGTLRVRRMRPVATGQGKMESIGRARS
jgi:hypothetical protein